MTIAYNKFNDFTEQLMRGVHDWDAHVFRVALTNTAPSATDASWLPGTTAPPPAAANGYPAGGIVTTISIAETAGTTTIQGTQAVFTAAGGTIGPFRYIILYNDTSSSPADACIAWWDYGSSQTINDTESFTFQFNSASPGTILTIA